MLSQFLHRPFQWVPVHPVHPAKHTRAHSLALFDCFLFAVIFCCHLCHCVFKIVVRHFTPQRQGMPHPHPDELLPLIFLSFSFPHCILLWCPDHLKAHSSMPGESVISSLVLSLSWWPRTQSNSTKSCFSAVCRISSSTSCSPLVLLVGMCPFHLFLTLFIASSSSTHVAICSSQSCAHGSQSCQHVCQFQARPCPMHLWLQRVVCIV